MSFSEKYQNIYNTVSEDIERVKKEVLLELKNSFELTSDLEQLFNSPSKHIRAALSLLYLKANNIEADENQIKFQAIIELIHNGSLIHDDIIDNSDIRRNHTTLNASHGNHLSVIAGDLVLSFALKKIAELNSGTVLKLVSDTITRMCEGEIHQYYSKYKIPTEKEYITKTYNKTGTLFETAIKGAAILSGNTDNIKNAELFGKYFGIAFQIRDDIKNIENNQPDSDIKNGIYTAAVIYSNNPDNPSEGIEKAKALLDNYVRKAENTISDIKTNKYKSAIIELLELINHE